MAVTEQEHDRAVLEGVDRVIRSAKSQNRRLVSITLSHDDRRRLTRAVLATGIPVIPTSGEPRFGSHITRYRDVQIDAGDTGGSVFITMHEDA